MFNPVTDPRNRIYYRYRYIVIIMQISKRCGIVITNVKAKETRTQCPYYSTKPYVAEKELKV